MHPSPPLHTGPNLPDGTPTWFARIDQPEPVTDYEYRVSEGDTWQPLANTHLAGNVFVQVRRALPDGAATLWVAAVDPTEQAMCPPVTSVTFAELHALVDTELTPSTASEWGSDWRRQLAAAIWELFTP